MRSSISSGFAAWMSLQLAIVGSNIHEASSASFVSSVQKSSRNSFAFGGKQNNFRQLNAVCDVDEAASSVTIYGEAVRQAVLTDALDNKITLGDKMGDGKSIVIFLRHLG